MGLFSSIIGAVAGPLIGGLFGKKKEKPQEVTNRVDYGRMVKDAEAAGFNPLTALRNGGSAGFGVQSMPSMTGNTNPWGDAISSAFNAWNNYDPHAQKRESLTHDLMQAQLANIQADTSLKLRPQRNSFNVPVKLAAQTTKGIGLAAAPAGLGSPTTPEAGDVAVTNPWQTKKVDPKVRDAQNFEDRYGDSEIGSMLYGTYVGFNDIKENVKEWWNNDDEFLKKTMGKDYKKTIAKKTEEKAKRVKDWKNQSNAMHKKQFPNAKSLPW